MKPPLRVLYLVYWGACEPLGQALVLPAVCRLAAMGIRLTLITFEKPADFRNRETMRQVRLQLQQNQIDWMPLRYHQRPKVPATAFDIGRGWLRGLSKHFQKRFDIIHARTFIGGLVGMTLAPMLRAKLIYHNEGFYPDEQVDAGVWKADSAAHRLAKFLEGRMYLRAQSLIVLSRRAKEQVAALPGVGRKKTPIRVVPSCADLNRFCPDGKPARFNGRELRLIYVGNAGGRYRLDQVSRFAAIAGRVVPHVHLRIVTKSDRNFVAEMIHSSGLHDSCWSMVNLPHEQIAAELRRHHAGIHFLPRGLSEHGGSPTKIGEYWGCGLPVVVTNNIADLDKIVPLHRAGVVIREHDASSYRRAVRQLQELLCDANLARRCRSAAETHYSLEKACQEQFQLYQQLVSDPTRADLSLQTAANFKIQFPNSESNVIESRSEMCPCQ